MLNIRRTQLEAFQPVAENCFLREVVEYLREEHADAAVRTAEGETPLGELPDDRLREMARRGIARARAYGMTWESTITAYVVLMFVVAPNFDDHPLIRRVLEDREVEPDLRVDGLWDKTTEENWQVAAEGYDPGAWGLNP